MQYVYYGNYAAYYEVGRVEAFRSLGYTYKEMESELGVMMPVMAMQIRYIRPAFYDDLLTLTTSIRQLPDMDILFHFEIKNEQGKLLNGATVKLCFVDTKTGKRCPTPAPMLAALRPYFSDKWGGNP